MHEILKKLDGQLVVIILNGGRIFRGRLSYDRKVIGESLVTEIMLEDERDAVLWHFNGVFDIQAIGFIEE